MKPRLPRFLRKNSELAGSSSGSSTSFGSNDSLSFPRDNIYSCSRRSPSRLSYSSARTSISSSRSTCAVLKFAERYQDDSESEYNELCDAFKIIDVDGDGKISASELGAVFRSLGDSVSDEELRHMVDAVKSREKGNISLQEFIDVNTLPISRGGTVAASGTESSKELRAAFGLLDRNKSDSISPYDLHQALQALGESTLTIEECCTMVKSVDSDDDGLINFQEFEKMMSSGNRVRSLSRP